jgi:NarL family two-component system response regulator LiaR
MDGSAQSLSVMLVDDQRIFREGLRNLLVEQGFEVVGEAATADEAISVAAKKRPRVALMDIRVAHGSGIEATRTLTRRFPEIRVVMLTASPDQADIVESVQAGAAGYLLKGASIEEIAAGVRAAANGEARLSPPVTEELLERLREAPPARGLPGGPRLSGRELEVLRLIADGKGNPEIAKLLGISDQTVKTYVSGLLGKLGVENRTQAAVYAVRNGLL